MRASLLPLIVALTLGALTAKTQADNFTQWLQTKAEAEPDQARRLALGSATGQTIEAYTSEQQLQTEGALFNEMRPPVEYRQPWAHGSIELSGEESEIIAATWKDPGFSTAVSIGIWIKPDFGMFEKSKEGRFIVSKSASIESGYFLSIGPDRSITAAIVTSSGFVSTRATQVLENYRWSHIGFSWNGETLQLYVDGEKKGDSVAAEGEFKDYTLGALTIGRPASLPTRYYKGLVADFILLPEAFQ